MGADQSSVAAPTDGILVVSSPNSVSTIESDEDYQRIMNLPSFEPILNTHIDAEVKLSHMDRINPVHFTKMVNRYCQHLRKCDIFLTSYQHQLIVKVKESDQRSKQVLQVMREREKKFQKTVTGSMRLSILKNELKILHSALEQISILCDELNNGLPPNQRQEPFSVSAFLKK